MAFAVLLMALLAAPITVFGQSNYASHGNSVEFEPGLPDQATLDGKVTKLDELSPVIFLNRTKAALNCAAGTMEADLKFEEPFYGIAYADFNRNSPCVVSGNGSMSYRLEMPLKGCGTKQEPQRVFTNNIVVRFHPGLEMDGDEVITIVCRYPPPVAPIPAALPVPLQDLPPAAPLIPPLKGFQILLVVCAILFLSLVLLGLGASYYCLSRRRLAVVRRRPATASLAGSEITKLSGSTLGSISLFEGLKIPRAAVTPAAAGSSSLSGSEAALIIDDHSDTLPSDYPSESPSSAHSEVEVATQRRAPSEVSSVYDNSAYAEESMFIQNQIVTPPPPQFDVSVRVKRAAPTPPPRASSSTAASSHCSTPPPPLPVMPPPRAIADSATAEAMRIQERNLTTILEREGKMATPSPIPYASHAHLTVAPEPQPTVTITSRPPVYSRILRRQKSDETDLKLQRRDSLSTLNTEMTDTHSVSEIMEDTPQRIQLEPPVVALRKPEITQHVVDDVFLRTITEKRIIEDIERRKREVTEFHARIPPPPPPPQFDVAIRTYPDPNSQQDWERYSTASSSTMVSEIQPNYRAETSMEPALNVTSTSEHYLSSIEVPIPPQPVPNWDVLIRVLDPPEVFTSTYTKEPDLHSPQLVSQINEGMMMHQDDDSASVCSSLASILTEADREKWRQIITTESTLRTLLTEATVREDYERIRHDQRYEKLFEPQKWDVIIRVLAPPPEEEEEHIRIYEQRQGASKYRKNVTSRDSNWDNRSRRSSLPTLYEFDSDAASSSAANDRPPKVEARSRRTSRSSMHSGMDVRSMSEFTVNDQYRPDDFAYSDVSGPSYGGSRYDDDLESTGSHNQYPSSLMRSASQPSLARSASEFTERRWALESTAAGDLMASSPEQTPVLERRARSSELLLLQTSTTSSFTSSSAHQQHWSDANYK